MVPVIIAAVAGLAGYKAWKNHKTTGHVLGTHAPISPTHYTGAPGDALPSIKARFGFPQGKASDDAFKAANAGKAFTDIVLAKGLINLPPGAVDKGPVAHAMGKAS